MGDKMSVCRQITPNLYMAQRYDNNNAKAKKKPSRLQELPFFRFCPTYLVSFFSKNFLYLLLNLSTRPALSTSFILPV